MLDRTSKSAVLTGRRFGRLLVIAPASHPSRHVYWLCQCDCGGQAKVRGPHLLSRAVKSCGCLRRGQLVTHGKSNSREYKAWRAMIRRCTDPKNGSYKRYGAKGITVTDRWLIFEHFYADMGLMPDTAQHWTIERRDNSLGYSPENCRWATSLEQGANMKSNHRLMFKGQLRHIAEWARITGLKASTIWDRVTRQQLTAEEALLRPLLSAKEASALALHARYGSRDEQGYECDGRNCPPRAHDHKVLI